MERLSEDDLICEGYQTYNIFLQLNEDTDKIEKSKNKPEINRRVLLPPFSKYDYMLLCMNIAKGDIDKRNELYNNWNLSDIYEEYAIHLTYNYQELPKDFK